ncbi:YdbC family protein [Bacillus smithii]|uniref:YdbC family protein n=1 Tax=Bacillus smithii TaxID=1479 RepID=UPI003D1FE2AA
MTTINFEIKKEIALLSTSSKGWKKELNLISWNGYAPKYDIRDWDPTHTKMGKGITLSEEELRNLYLSLKKIFEDSTNENNFDKIKEEIHQFYEQAPLFIQELKNIVIYMDEKGISDSDKKDYFLATPIATTENALINEIESISSIYGSLLNRFLQILTKASEKEQSFLFNEIRKA